MSDFVIMVWRRLIDLETWRVTAEDVEIYKDYTKCTVVTRNCLMGSSTVGPYENSVIEYYP